MTGLFINQVDRFIEAFGAFAILSGIGLYFRRERIQGTVLISTLNICLGIAIPLANSVTRFEPAMQPYIRLVVSELVMFAGILSFVYQDKLCDVTPYSWLKIALLVLLQVSPALLHQSILLRLGIHPNFQWGGIFATIATLVLNLISIYRIKIKIRGDQMSVRNRLLLAALVLLSSGAVTLWLVGHLSSDQGLEKWGRIVASITGLYGFYLTQYSREFLPFVCYEINRNANRKSNLDKLDGEFVATQLEFAMKEKKLYREWELKMPELAAEVGITSHQLSEYLNKVVRMNFNRYVNAYRIAEAKELLLGGEHSVLDVCYLVGFNSLSAFSRAFRDIVGTAPGKFAGRGKPRPQRTEGE